MNMNGTRHRSSPFAFAAIAAPLVIAVGGCLIVLATPLAESDWFGMALIVRAGAALIIASITSVLCTAGSFIRRESKAITALWTAIPAAFFLMFVLARLGPAYSENKMLSRKAELRKQILADPEFRRSFVMSEELSVRDADIFIVREVADVLTADEVRQLWGKWKLIRTGSNFEALIMSKNTSPDVLIDFYKTIMNSVPGMQKGPPPRDIVFPRTFLLHQNLPRELLDELYQLNNSENIRILRERNVPDPASSASRSL